MRQNTMFTSIGSRLTGISGSTRGARCLNSFVGRPDSLSRQTKIRIDEVQKNEGRVYMVASIVMSFKIMVEYCIVKGFKTEEKSKLEKQIKNRLLHLDTA